MSRLTKYLKQLCSLERAETDLQGVVELDRYGEPLYAQPIQVRCRRESYIKDTPTSTGAVMHSSTRYFLEGTTKVSVGDRIDNRAVIAVETYINSLGQIEGYECYV